MAKAGREKIKLESTAGTGHFYTTTKNKRTTPGKDRDCQVRPKGKKACPLQGSQDQVSLPFAEQAGFMPAFHFTNGYTW